MILTAAITAITSMLADKGLGAVSKAIEGGADKAIELVSKKTGIDLSSKKELTAQDIEKLKVFQSTHLKELEMFYADRADARNMNVKLQASKDWLVRNAGSLISIFVVVSTFGLWLCMLVGITDNLNQTVLMSINSSLTLSLGYVLSFYYGSSKTEADSKREG